MKRKTAVWLTVAGILIVLGGILFCIAMTGLRWNFGKLSTQTYETHEHRIEENITGISVTTATADVTLVYTPEETLRVVCFAPENETYTVSVEEGILTVQFQDESRWYDHIGIWTEAPQITVYLPGQAYGSLTVQSVTGSVSIPEDFAFDSMDLSAGTGHLENRGSAAGAIRLCTGTGSVLTEGISAGSLEIAVTTGSVTISETNCEGELTVTCGTGKTRIRNVQCGSLSSVGNTGELNMYRVEVREDLSVERTTGDVEFELCDASRLVIQTETGDVEGSLLTEKIFIAQTDTGEVEIPRSASGGECRITTETGDIEIELAKKY